VWKKEQIEHAKKELVQQLSISHKHVMAPSIRQPPITEERGSMYHSLAPKQGKSLKGDNEKGRSPDITFDDTTNRDRQ
jgi:hypothetical protein